MKWFKHCLLSDDDMEKLAGTSMMERLVANRLIVMFGPEEEQPSFEQLGCDAIENPFFLFRQNKETLEFYFSEPDDLVRMEELLTVCKMTVD